MGAVLPDNIVQQDILSQSEKDYFRDYNNECVEKYNQTIGFDLTMDMEVRKINTTIKKPIRK